MNLEYIFRLIGRRLLGQLINRGLNTATKGNRQQTRQAKQTSKRARQAMRLTRKFGRF